MNLVKALINYIDKYLVEFICSFWFVIVIFNYFPGNSDCPDCQWQLEQARTGVYFDHHPPIMAWLMRQFLFIGEPASSLFLLHVIFFLVGFYLILKSLQKINNNYKWCVFAIFFALSPVVEIQNILKDNGMLAGFIFFTGSLLYSQYVQSKKEKALFLIPGFIACFYAIAIRGNAILAAPALCFLAFLILIPQRSLILKICLTGFLLLVFYIFTNLFNYGVCNATKNNIIRYPMIADIVAIDSQTSTRTPLLDSCYSKEVMDSFHANYILASINVDPLYFRKGTPSKEELFPVWINRIQNEPLLALKARAKMLLSFLATDDVLDRLGLFTYPDHLPRIIRLQSIPIKLFLYLTGFIYFIICLIRFVHSDKKESPVSINTIKCALLGSAFGLYSTFLIFLMANPNRYIEYSTYLIIFVFVIALFELKIKKDFKINSWAKKILLSFFILTFIITTFFTFCSLYLIRERTFSGAKLENVNYIFKMLDYKWYISDTFKGLKSMTGNYNFSTPIDDVYIWKLQLFDLSLMYYSHSEDRFESLNMPKNLIEFDPVKFKNK